MRPPDFYHVIVGKDTGFRSWPLGIFEEKIVLTTSIENVSPFRYLQFGEKAVIESLFYNLGLCNPLEY